MSLFTKRERSLIFSALKKSTFLKSMLLLNFLIRWSWNILNLFNISMMLNKCIIRWFWVNVITKAPNFMPLFVPIFEADKGSIKKARVVLALADQTQLTFKIFKLFLMVLVLHMNTLLLLSNLQIILQRNNNIYFSISGLIFDNFRVFNQSTF